MYRKKIYALIILFDIHVSSYFEISVFEITQVSHILYALVK